MSVHLNLGNFTVDRVCNIDETGVFTVVQSPNIVAQIGTKKVWQAVSGERGTMFTVGVIISSVGNTVPPVFIFPRVRNHDSLNFGSPPGNFGLLNVPRSSLITGLLYLKVIEHVKKHTRSSKKDGIILRMDNHESHCSLDFILYARKTASH